jgi:hypothetical protein
VLLRDSSSYVGASRERQVERGSKSTAEAGVQKTSHRVACYHGSRSLMLFTGTASEAADSYSNQHHDNTCSNKNAG